MITLNYGLNKETLKFANDCYCQVLETFMKVIILEKIQNLY